MPFGSLAMITDNAFREGKPALGVIPLSHAWLLHVGEDHKGLEFMIKTPVCVSVCVYLCYVGLVFVIFL